MFYGQLKQNKMEKHEKLIDQLDGLMTSSMALCTLQIAEKTRNPEIVKRFLMRIETLKRHAHYLFAKRVSFILTHANSLKERVCAVKTLFVELIWRIEKDAEEFFRFLYNKEPRIIGL